MSVWGSYIRQKEKELKKKGYVQILELGSFKERYMVFKKEFEAQFGRR